MRHRFFRQAEVAALLGRCLSERHTPFSLGVSDRVPFDVHSGSAAEHCRSQINGAADC